MDITWYGHSCFRITERSRISIVTDPYSDGSIGLPAPSKLKADVVTMSHDAPGHNAADLVKGHTYTLAGPGEYEIGGVFIYGLAMHHLTHDGKALENVAYVIQYDNLNVLHLGDLAHVPDQSTIQDLGEINVAIVPVGGGRGLSATAAAEVIALIEPSYIIPMHYDIPGLSLKLDPVDKFLKEMGVSKVQEEETLKVTASDLPEQPQVVVLQPQIG